MDDLETCEDRDVEDYDFQCKSRHVSKPSLQPTQPSPPTQHSNLLASSSQYGHLFAATNAEIIVFAHADVSNRDADTIPIARVDLTSLDIAVVKHVILLRAETVLAVLATRASDPAQTILFFLHVTALVDGRAHSIPAPSITGLEAMATASLPADNIQTMQSNSLFICMTDTLILTYDLADDSVRLVNTLSYPGALSMALSPDQDILAVGTPRGSVALYDPKNGTLLGTVVEVESGWQPFQLNFAGREWLLTSYEKEENLNHIMRQFTKTNDTVAITQTSSLRNMCFSTIPDPGNQQVGLPSITFMYIEEWRLGIMASSLSEDSEIFQLEDDEWVIWRMSEDSAPQMHYYNNDVTFVLGLAIAFNDMSTTPPLDPDDPTINPMPTLIYLNSAWFLLSYRMVDFKKNASCKALRNSIPLPSGPDMPAVPTAASVPSPVQNSAPESDATAPTEIDITGDKQTVFTPSFHSSISPRARIIVESSETESSSESSSDGPTGSEAESLTDDSDLVEHSPSVLTPPVISPSFVVTPSNTSHFMKPPIPVQSFTDTKPFLSNFNFPEQAFPQSTTAKTAESGFGMPQQKTSTNFSNISTQQPQPPSSSIQQPAKKVEVPRKDIPLPTVRLQPRLDKAMAAMQQSRGDDPLTAVQSILSEMEADLAVTEQASSATREELGTLNDPITSLTDETMKELSGTLQVLLQRYEAEKQLRASATETMTQILKLHRDYETIRMEDGVRVKNGPSHNLREEYKTADELMSRREAEIEKMIRLIEDKLGSPRLLRNRRKDPSETLQMIYSSLSLQGLRIKRVLSLLTTLVDRVETDELGGRRSDLGLSLARLEKLSLGSELESAEKGKHLPKKETNVARDSAAARENKDSANLSSEDAVENSELLPKDVVGVLRQLAMRQGRECISVESPPRRQPSGQGAVSLKQGSGVPLNNSSDASQELGSGAKSGPLPPPPGLEYDGRPMAHLSSRAQKPASGFGTSAQRQAPTPPPLMQAGPSGKGRPSQPAMSPLVGAEISSLTGPSAESPFAKLDVPPSGWSSSRGKWTTVQTSVARPPMVPHKKLAPSHSQPPAAKAAFASLPPDDNEPARAKGSPLRKAIPPSSAQLQTPGKAKTESVRTKRSVEVASLPPGGEDDEDLGSSSGPGVFGSAAGVEQLARKKPGGLFVSLPFGDDAAGEAKGFFAALPPDDVNTKEPAGLFASLPPENDVGSKKSKPSASSPPLDDKTDTKGGLAVLPPEEDRGSKRAASFAALPPDEDTDLPPDEDTDSKKGGFAGLSPDDDGGSKRVGFATLPPDNDNEGAKSNLFASLPPGVGSNTPTANPPASSAADFSNTFPTAPLGTQAEVLSSAPSGFGTFAAAQGEAGSSAPSSAFNSFGIGNAPAASSPASSHSPELGLFGSALSLGGGASPTFFASGGQSSAGQSTSFFAPSSSGDMTGGSAFAPSFGSGAGLSASFGGAQGGDSSMFGAAADMAKVGERMGGGSQAVGNDGTSSEDSDGGSFNRRQGMDDLPATVQTSGFPPSQSGSAPPFGNAETMAPFGNAFGAGGNNTNSSPFGGGGGTGGGSAFGQGFGGGPGGNSQGSPSGFVLPTGGGNPPVAPGFTASSGFGGNAFGNAVSAPTFGISSSFGAPSPLGAGAASPQAFGPPSGFAQGGFGSGGASASPFGEVPGGASPFATPTGASGFGASSGGGSAFAALAASDSGLSFGNGQPPSFTSPAFSERRA